MKARQFLIAGIGLFFWTTPLRSNPMLAGYLNELQFTTGGWVLEMHSRGHMNLDGWSLASGSGSALFKNGIQLDPSLYVIITQDSLMNPLEINALGDDVSLFSPDSNWVDGFAFGIVFPWTPAPRPGQSLCLKQTSPQFYYLDNSPTPGLRNDELNATGVVSGLVTDTLGLPISNASILWINSPLGLPTYSNGSGHFGLSDYATRFTLRLQHSNFEDQFISVQIWPESTVAVTVVMRRIVSVREGLTAPEAYALQQNHPNPFNPATIFSFTLPRSSFVTLKIYDVHGREVATVVNGMRSPGRNEARWDASGMASGVYFYRLIAGEFMQTRKMVLTR